MDCPKLNSPTCHNPCEIKHGLQFAISWIWSWKITRAWPNFNPLPYN